MSVLSTVELITLLLNFCAAIFLFILIFCSFQAGIPDPPSMSEDLIRQKARERHFLEQLLDGRKLENYKIPVPIKAELRKYQQVCLLFTLPSMEVSLFLIKSRDPEMEMRLITVINKKV